MDNDISCKVSFDAIDELSNISTSNSVFFELMVNIISQVSNFLEPALQKCYKLQKSIIEFCLLLFFTNGGEIFA